MPTMKLSRDIVSFLVLLISGLVGVYALYGGEGVVKGVTRSLKLLIEIAPIILAAMLIGSYFQTVVPRERVACIGTINGIFYETAK